MKYLNLAVLLILCGLLVTSCYPNRKQQRREAKCDKWGVCREAKDCTVIVESVKIDTITTDNSEFWANILFGCDSMGNVYISAIDSIKAVNADLTTKLKNNRMVIYVNKPAEDVPCPPATTKIEYIEKVVEKITNKLTRWQNIFYWSGLIVWGAFILFIIFVVIKELRRFL